MINATSQASSNDEDDEPVGPDTYTTITNIPLTQGLVRRLAELIAAENPGDFAEVGQDLIAIGGDILVQTIERQRFARFEIEGKTEGGRGNVPS